jgi:cytochrome oxidase assembly protein ShyY1
LRKWFNWIALVTVFTVACVLLAGWQLDRRDLKLASIGLIQTNYQREPISLEESLTSNSFKLPEETWQSVRVTGSYLSADLLLVRNRPNNGQPGFEQLVPFRADSGLVIFVSRGWLPTGSKQDLPDQNPRPSNSQTTIVGRVVPSEPKLDRSAPTGQIASINSELATELTNLENTVANGYLRLVSETPEASIALKSMPSPSINEGNNLSYAAQWITFAIMAIWALIWRARRDAQLASGTVKVRRRKSRSEIDQDAEDEITRAI